MQTQNLIPVQEFCMHHNIEVSFIHSLEEYGLVETTLVENDIFVNGFQLQSLEKIFRLHYDLDINLEGIDVIKNLLEQVENMQQEIIQLKNKLRFYEK